MSVTARNLLLGGDRKVFLHRLGQVCGSHGWKVYAWVLMGKEALRILREGSGLLGLPLRKADLQALRKSDSRKVQLAILLRSHTSVSNGWIAQKLAMGHPGSVSRSVSDGKADKTMGKSIKNIERMLIRVI